MTLTDQQTARLTDLVQVGCDRGAEVLLHCTGVRIQVEPPSVSILSVSDLRAQLDGPLGGNAVAVSLPFTGPIAGQGMFLLEERSAIALCDMLGHSSGSATPRPTSDEIVTETGSIMLNACLGNLGNFLDVDVAFAVPQLRIDSVPALLAPPLVHDEDLSRALLVETRLRLKSTEVIGYITIALGFDSLERVVGALDAKPPA